MSSPACPEFPALLPAHESVQPGWEQEKHPKWWHIKRTQSVPFLPYLLSFLLALGDKIDVVCIFKNTKFWVRRFPEIFLLDIYGWINWKNSMTTRASTQHLFFSLNGIIFLLARVTRRVWDCVFCLFFWEGGTQRILIFNPKLKYYQV